MAILSLANLCFSYGDHQVLDGVNLTLDHGEHVGMVGRNGQGKSTLMKLIAGLGPYKPDQGQIQLSRGAKAGYLHQDPELMPNRTLREEAGAAFGDLQKLHDQLHQISDQMAHAQGTELDKLLKRYEALEHQMEAAGGYAVDHQIDQALHGLGLGNDTFDVKVKDLSGGQRGRLALAKLLLTNPDLLLLDEPTNHLDIAGRQWLQEYLSNYNKAVILISHDRWLLDHVVSRIYEVELGRVYEYPGNFAQFMTQRAQRRLVNQRVYEKQQDRIRQEKGFIDRYRSGQRSKQAQGREKRLQRFIDQEQVDRPIELDVMALNLPAAPRVGDVVLSCEGLTKRYDGKTLFENLNVTVRRGDRIGIVGPNGAGKSTLVRCLLGEQEADSGISKLGAQVQVGHFRQTHEDMAPDLTVIEYLVKHIPNQVVQVARDLAGAFLFSGQDQEQPLGLLSGGERARVALAALVAGTHNLLVLDEPTNHLDVLSSQKLEETLKVFTAERDGWGEKTRGGGTLILITHDRMLLDNLVDQIIVFDGKGHARHFWGNYSDYLESQKTADTLADVSNASKSSKSSKGSGKSSKRHTSASSASKKTKTQQDKKRQRASRSDKGNSVSRGAISKMNLEKIEQRIMQIEQEILLIDKELALPQTYRDPDKATTLQESRQRLQEQLKPLEDEWSLRA